MSVYSSDGAIRVVTTDGAGNSTAATLGRALPAASEPVVIAPNAYIATSQATVTTSSQQILPSRATRVDVTIENLGTTAVWFGAAGVSPTTGFLLPGVVGASVSFTATAAIHGVTATGTATVAFLESYQ